MFNARVNVIIRVCYKIYYVCVRDDIVFDIILLQFWKWDRTRMSFYDFIFSSCKEGVVYFYCSGFCCQGTRTAMVLRIQVKKISHWIPSNRLSCTRNFWKFNWRYFALLGDDVTAYEYYDDYIILKL